MGDFVVRKSIYINATPDQVWDALTNPKKTKKYFFNCEVFSDWKPTSKITFKGRMFFLFKIEMTGEIISAEHGRMLKYSLINKGGTTSVVTDELIDEGDATRINITDDVGAGEGVEERYNRSFKGWDKILKGLKKIVENG